MATTTTHPAAEHHHQAAAHHAAAAHHHLEAAHHHEVGEHDEAKKHAEAALRHSEHGHKHTTTAHQHSHKLRLVPLRARGVVRLPWPLGSRSANAPPISPIEATSEVGIVSSATTEEPAGAGRALRKVITHEDFIGWFTRVGAGYPHRVQSGHAGGTGNDQPAPETTRLRRGRKDVQAERASDVNHPPPGRNERSRDRYRAAARTSRGTSRSSSPTDPKE